MLTAPHEKILRAIHFYRYMSAQDVAHLLYSPASLTYARSLLAALSGGADGKTAQYLYRFQLPSTSSGGAEKIYTLGSKGRDFLANEIGLSVDWYFRPHKVRHFSYSQVLHNLVLTRFLVAVASWSAKQANFRLIKTRLCYELSRLPAMVEVAKTGKSEWLQVIPDAWLLLEILKEGSHQHFMPVWLEVDRGTEFKPRFMRHVHSRIEYIRSGAYRNMFHTEAVIIAYVTTGDRPEYRQTRQKAMCEWTQEVLADLRLANWSSIFRISSVVFEDLYTSPLFDAPVWYIPGSPTPIPLFTA
jgi:hypothetical protein